MRGRFAYLVALALAFASPVAAAIGTPVNVGGNGNGSGVSTTVVITPANTAVAGTLVVVLAGVTNSTLINSISDTNGNTWTADTTVSVNGQNYRLFYCIANANLDNTDTITVTYSATSGNKVVGVSSVSGVNTSSPRDLGLVGSFGSGTAASTTTGTLAQADEIVFGYTWVNGGQGDGFTKDPSFSTLGAYFADVGSSALHIEYRIVNSTVPVTNAATLGTSRNWISLAPTFKAAGGPGVQTFRSLTGAGK